MNKSPHVGIPLIGASQGTPRARTNELAFHADFHAAGRVLKSLAAPPGSPADGDAYWVIATASGDWTGKENKIAVAYNAGTDWYFLDPYNGMQALFDRREATTPFPEMQVYWDATEKWVPVLDRWTDVDSDVAAEHFIGRYHNGKKRYAKTLDFGALPNNTTKNLAHSITSIDLAYKSCPWFWIRTSSGSIAIPFGNTFADIVALTNVRFYVGSVNFSCATNSDFSTTSAIVRIEYSRTA